MASPAKELSTIKHVFKNYSNSAFEITQKENKMSGSLNDSSAFIERPENLTPEKKRKQSGAEELTNCKKSRKDTQNTFSLSKVINLGIPHVGEQIFFFF